MFSVAPLGEEGHISSHKKILLLGCVRVTAVRQGCVCVCVCCLVTQCVCVCVPQDVRVYNEEVELEVRDPQQDYMLYKDTCAALAKLMAEIQELKSAGAKVGVSFTCHASKNGNE